MKHLPEFWKNTLSNTLGTVIGIALTFGTTLCLQHLEQKKAERTAALMVIHNLDAFCEMLEDEINDLQKTDSINSMVWDQHTERQIPEDTLQLFFNDLFGINYQCNDNTVESIFGSNIETWTNIGNSEFIEIAGKCFSTRRMVNQAREEMDREKKHIWYTYMTTAVYTDKPVETLREAIDWVFCSAEMCCFIRRQHLWYIPALQTGLMVIREQNERNKLLMHISDEELQQFGEQGEHKSYTFKSE